MALILAIVSTVILGAELYVIIASAIMMMDKE